ncbi:MAG: 50S ribosomal protein L15 [Candidatus Marinimicrobia bacterium]|nr:50S ribosomal protein L15 [Candidatus Neomarinimicrobiota bacterium]
MDLSKLKPAKGYKKNSKRIGRGEGSGYGVTAGRGENGAMSRSGSKHYSWFEGGQMPLQRRIPKFGFSNKRFKKVFEIVNVKDLNTITKKKINKEVLKEHGLIKKTQLPLKILGDGEITKEIEIEANAFSKSAKEKIEKANGKVIVL